MLPPAVNSPEPVGMSPCQAAWAFETGMGLLMVGGWCGQAFLAAISAI